jgi:hypothetical protein
MTKEQIAGVLERIAMLLELKGENPFKIRAYTNAARAIETFGGNVANFKISKRKWNVCLPQNSPFSANGLRNLLLLSVEEAEHAARGVLSSEGLARCLL